MSSVYPEFGKLLEHYLRVNDRSAAWLANKLGLYSSTVGRWMNDSTRPNNVDVVLQIADLFNMSDMRERQELLKSAGYSHVAKTLAKGSISSLQPTVKSALKTANLGTTSFVHIAQDGVGKSVVPGESYFLIKILGIQAAFKGDVWHDIEQLMIISKVGFDSGRLGIPSVETVQGRYTVKPGLLEKSHSQATLVEIAPATMAKLSLVTEFIDDKCRKALMRFGKDFDMFEDVGEFSLREGYYAALGSQDVYSPLPKLEQLETLAVQNGELWMSCQPVTDYSYILLQVFCLEARTRFYNSSHIPEWEVKLREAEALVSDVTDPILSVGASREDVWTLCLSLLKDARSLLYADPFYLRREADNIYKTLAYACHEELFGEEKTRSLKRQGSGKDVLPERVQADLAMLEIDPDEDLEETLTEYAMQVARTRRFLRKQGIGG